MLTDRAWRGLLFFMDDGASSRELWRRATHVRGGIEERSRRDGSVRRGADLDARGAAGPLAFAADERRRALGAGTVHPHVDVPLMGSCPIRIALPAVVFHDHVFFDERNIKNRPGRKFGLVRLERDGVRVRARATRAAMRRR